MAGMLQDPITCLFRGAVDIWAAQAAGLLRAARRTLSLLRGGARTELRLWKESSEGTGVNEGCLAPS